MRYQTPYCAGEKLVGITFWETNKIWKYLFPKNVLTSCLGIFPTEIIIIKNTMHPNFHGLIDSKQMPPSKITTNREIK